MTITLDANRVLDVVRDIPIAAGDHRPISGEACLTEKVSILYALVDDDVDIVDMFDDVPLCTNEVVARVGQHLNDESSTKIERRRLQRHIPRLLRCHRTGRDAAIAVRLALWAADDASIWFDDEVYTAATAVVRAARRCFDAPGGDTLDGLRRAVVDSYIAACQPLDGRPRLAMHVVGDTARLVHSYAEATVAGVAAPSQAVLAATCLNSLYQSVWPGSPTHFLGALLDAWEDAMGAEGQQIPGPWPWESQAVAAIDSYLAQA